MFTRKKRPDARDVATRAIILRHVAVYALVNPPHDVLAEITNQWPAEELEKFRLASVQKRDEFWSQIGPLRSQMSPWEREFAACTPLTMTSAQQVKASWRVEAFQVLLWALSACAEVPPYDTQADHDLLKTFPPSIKTPSLISPEHIDQARDDAELWHWRSRTRQLVEEGAPFSDDPQLAAAGFRSYDDIVRATARHAAAESRIKLLDGDFGVLGKPYTAMDQAEWNTVHSITIERHFALNWLCGYAPANRWDETPTDT